MRERFSIGLSWEYDQMLANLVQLPQSINNTLMKVCSSLVPFFVHQKVCIQSSPEGLFHGHKHQLYLG